MRRMNGEERSRFEIIMEDAISEHDANRYATNGLTEIYELEDFAALIREIEEGTAGIGAFQCDGFYCHYEALDKDEQAETLMEWKRALAKDRDALTHLEWSIVEHDGTEYLIEYAR